MIYEHWFWFGITAACVIWYSTITVYVAIRGFGDIKSMLKKLKGSQSSKDTSVTVEKFPNKNEFH